MCFWKKSVCPVEDTSSKPSWLDTSTYPYIPNIMIAEWTGQLSDPREIYASNQLIKNLVVNGTKGMNNDQKLLWIWQYVVNALSYAYDVNDDWQFPIVTYYRKEGDCEDGTILFVEMCRWANIPADSYFNACGYFTEQGVKNGHSFPIAKMSDGKFYVFESTLDGTVTSPKLFMGSPYDSSWGLCNFKYCGIIKNGNQI
jgi:transglutaminase-like putative cysteine protease